MFSPVPLCLLMQTGNYLPVLVVAFVLIVLATRGGRSHAPKKPTRKKRTRKTTVQIEERD